MLKGFWKVCRAPRSFAASKTFFSPPTPEIAMTLAWRNYASAPESFPVHLARAWQCL